MQPTKNQFDHHHNHITCTWYEPSTDDAVLSIKRFVCHQVTLHIGQCEDRLLIAVILVSRAHASAVILVYLHAASKITNTSKGRILPSATIEHSNMTSYPTRDIGVLDVDEDTDAPSTCHFGVALTTLLLPYTAGTAKMLARRCH